MGIVVAIVFAVWFCRAASRANEDVLAAAGLGAVIAIGSNYGAFFCGSLIVASVKEAVGPTGGFLVLVCVWLFGMAIAIVLGSRLLPEPSCAGLEVELAAREARAQSGEPAMLRCKRCDRELTMREALVQGAIRLDANSCICPDCKGAEEESTEAK